MQTRLFIAALLALSCASEDVYPGGELASPDGRLVATYYGRGGGGAAGWLYQYVSVRLADEEFESGRGDLMTFKGSWTACLSWESPDRLLVTYEPDADRRGGSLANEHLLPLTFLAERSSTQGSLEEECRGKYVVLSAPKTD